VGKLTAAFLFFVTSAAFAVREARAPLPSHAIVVTEPIEPQASDGVNGPELPDSARYARPFYAPPLPPPTPPTPPPITIEAPRGIVISEVSDGPSVDSVFANDKCPDHPEPGDDLDGCPEPVPPAVKPPPAYRDENDYDGSM
jgi:hypothetical protein